ncbi:flavin reductase family protein [Rubrivivax sp. RP6-9]|uniref:flavin reductase family protein n=1 Tax=Rubrivivax sp. RP6-9 TaxID=3415750 RepID=UPI003CC6AB0E
MRSPVALPHAYRLLNHGPTVLVSAAHGGHRNLMAAAWNMPLDFDPPKVAVVIDKSTCTRGLVEASGAFVLNLPCRAQADIAFTVGSTSGHDIDDKFARYGLATLPAERVAAPLLDGCVAWLECRVLPQPALQQALQQTHDLFLAEVVAAHADSRVFSGGRWHFGPEHAALRTLHHVAGGAFFSPADLLQARPLP